MKLIKSFQKWIAWCLKAFVHSGQDHTYQTIRHKPVGKSVNKVIFKGCACGVIHYLREGYSVTFEGPGKKGMVTAFQFEGQNYYRGVRPKRQKFPGADSPDAADIFEYETKQGAMSAKDLAHIQKHFDDLRKMWGSE